MPASLVQEPKLKLAVSGRAVPDARASYQIVTAAVARLIVTPCVMDQHPRRRGGMPVYLASALTTTIPIPKIVGTAERCEDYPGGLGRGILADVLFQLRLGLLRDWKTPRNATGEIPLKIRPPPADGLARIEARLGAQIAIPPIGSTLILSTPSRLGGIGRIVAA